MHPNRSKTTAPRRESNAHSEARPSRIYFNHAKPFSDPTSLIPAGASALHHPRLPANRPPSFLAARYLEAAAAEQAAAVAAAAEAETIAENQYRAGTVSYLNVVTAQATHLAARRTANDFAARRLVAAVQLAKNAGGGVGRPVNP
ncbi:MAG TPA: hypothetical protein PKA58_20385 [Polyangium sp.]|nr:hypothetical protein [Polyangium sp.]